MIRGACHRMGIALLILWFGLGLAPGEVHSQETRAGGIPGEQREESTRWQWEVDVGYGYGVDISSDATYLGDVRFWGMSPRLGRTAGGRFLADNPLEGRVRVFAEVPLWVSLAPERGYAVGATLLARYTVGISERIEPFAELGAGPVYLAFENERNQSDGLSFTLQGGGGIKVGLVSDWAVISRTHLHHISNAGLRSPNPGINDLLLTLGFVRHMP